MESRGDGLALALPVPVPLAVGKTVACAEGAVPKEVPDGAAPEPLGAALPLGAGVAQGCALQLPAAVDVAVTNELPVAPGVVVGAAEREAAKLLPVTEALLVAEMLIKVTVGVLCALRLPEPHSDCCGLSVAVGTAVNEA